MRGLNTVGIRTARYLLIRYSTGESEVYDLRDDPLELSSLRGRATRDLRRRLAGVWDRYAACAGAECRSLLPADLRRHRGRPPRSPLTRSVRDTGTTDTDPASPVPGSGHPGPGLAVGTV